MKLKTLPADFQVEEQTAVVPSSGPYALYRLTKEGLGTPEAIAAICRRWGVQDAQVSFGGLKDRHARTTQWMTIHRGPRRDLVQTNLELNYQGQVSQPFTSAAIRANRFRITLRDLAAERRLAFMARLTRAQRDGLPDYFDQQRFGSLGSSGEFVAKAWCRRDYSQAVRLALVDAVAADRPAQRRQKQLLEEHWGNWRKCWSLLGDSPWRPMLAHLSQRSDDFRGALRKIPASQRRFYLSAFQSYLWNRLLAATFEETLRREQLADVPLVARPATLPFPTEMDAVQREALHALRLPLPAWRNRLEEGPIRTRLEKLLAEEGLAMSDLKADEFRDSFFSKGDRAAIFIPQDVTAQWQDDELHTGREKLVLGFELPPGCYATVLVRWLAAAGFDG